MDNFDDFERYYYLTSDSSLEFYPANTPTSFKNQLQIPLAIDNEEDYECGLVELSFQDNYSVKAAEAEKPAKFFGHSEDDEELKTIKVNDTYISLGKWLATNTDDLIQLYKEELKRWKPTVTVELLIEFGLTKNVILRFTDIYNGVLTLSSNLAVALGFYQTEFTPGTYRAPMVFSNERFDSVDISDIFTITYSKFVFDFAILKEPAEYTLPALFKVIQDETKKQLKFDIKFEYDGKDTVKYECTADRLVIKLPAQINELLG